MARRGGVCGSDPFFRRPFRIGETASAALAAVGIAANDIFQQRSGRRQGVAIEVRRAAATLRTIDYAARRTPSGVFEPIPVPGAYAGMLTFTQPWPTRDGRWFLPHLNVPCLSERVPGVRGCESTPAVVAAAVSRRNADDLEQAIAEARACGVSYVLRRNGGRIHRVGYWRRNRWSGSQFEESAAEAVSWPSAAARRRA